MEQKNIMRVSEDSYLEVLQKEEDRKMVVMTKTVKKKSLILYKQYWAVTTSSGYKLYNSYMECLEAFYKLRRKV